MNKVFNIFAQCRKELDEFFADQISIANKQNKNSIRFLSGRDEGYMFNQYNTINKIEMYYNSQFDSGKYDSDGQRKLFLNVCAFRADVASKQIDIDVKNFVFIPETGASVWPAYFMQKDFRQWAKDNFFGEVINQVVMDLPKYGTAVLKRVGDTIERTPLLNLRNKQDAADLQTADYVIEEHKDMTMQQLSEMEDWDLSELDMEFGDKVTVYERYGHVPLSFYKETVLKEKPKEEDYKKSIDTMSIIVFGSKGMKEASGSLLFMEKIKKRPYEEAHWKRQDGRWMGVGEIENQFENQMARNMIANMRRKSLYWSSKKVFYSNSTETPKNLTQEVADGQVLALGTGGTITPVDMTSRSIAEFQNTEDVWEKNSDQKSFTFEVATGEALPSGTPFRLGVVLSNAVNSHFNLKREQLGLFFKRVVANQILDIFKRNMSREHVLSVFADEDGFETLKNVTIEKYSNERAFELMLEGKVVDFAQIRSQVEADIQKRKILFFDIIENLYKNVSAKVEIEITGESVDIPKRIETLTNLYNTMSQRQDPRADKVLTAVLALSGENVESFGQEAMQSAGQSALAVPQPQEQTV